MKPHGLLAHAAKQLSMTDREIAKELGLSIAALRSLDSPTCPRYLQLALAALMVDINADAILRMSIPSKASPASSRNQPLNAASKQAEPSYAPILDRGFDISLVLLAGSGAALADRCSAIKSQMRLAESTSNSQAAQIRRKIAAIRAIERQRSCTAERAAAGGFFNACHGLSQQRATAERELAATRSGGRNKASLRARYAAFGCEAVRSHIVHSRSG